MLDIPWFDFRVRRHAAADVINSNDYEMEEELEQWLKKNKLLKKLEKVFARLGIDDMDMLMLAADEGHLSKEALEREGVKPMTVLKLSRCLEKLSL